MASTFTSNVLKTALAVSLFAFLNAGALAMGGSSIFQHIKGQPVAASSFKTNMLVSKPGNSQDYMATGISNWQHTTNSAYTYDAAGRLTQRLYTDPTNNQNKGRELAIYDAKGNEIEFRAEEWNGTSWVILDAYKTLITYNSKGNKTDIIYQYWSPANNIWINDAREQTSYDANDLVASITNSNWVNSSWLLMDRTVISNVGGTATSIIIQEHNGTAWEDVYRAQNMTWRVLYDIPSAYVLEFNDNGIWVNEQKYAAVYDGNGGYVGISEEWDASSNSWKKSTRETQTYDTNKNFRGILSEDWNPIANLWDFGSETREVLTYSGINVTQRIYQDSWNPSGNLEDSRKELYSNFQIFDISGVKNMLPEAAVNVYPNPAADKIQIAFTDTKGNFTATIADVTGKTWLTETFESGEETALDIEALPNGIYLLQLQTEAGSIVKRIVKQ